VRKTGDSINRPEDSATPEPAEYICGSAGAGSDEKRQPEIQDPPLEDMTREQLISKLEAAREEAARNFDSFLRVTAEFENLKKRHARDREESRKFSNEALIKNLLGVIDNLEQALVHSDGDDETLACVCEGVELTLKGLMDVLAKEGVVRVPSLGQPFDPNFHEAVSEIEDDSVEAGTVVHELQSGYMLNGRLIRPSKVVVGRKSE